MAPTNLEQPTLNHVQSDTMASAVLADPTRALQGTNRGSKTAMEESENDVGSLEKLLLYADEHYLAVCGRALSCWKIAPGRPFRKSPTWGQRISST
ncbi:15-hydroxyprostaglandin dehydrogenase [Trichonephila clavipes]|nr:15-hydroxyprostaglandin dehydrogenase [Trichonephila clavipes]